MSSTRAGKLRVPHFSPLCLGRPLLADFLFQLLESFRLLVARQSLQQAVASLLRQAVVGQGVLAGAETSVGVWTGFRVLLLSVKTINTEYKFGLISSMNDFSPQKPA
jgi:hypothetical protein